MGDDKELPDKIAEFLEKTGFPLELDCTRLLASKGWSVSKGPSFLDPDESILRELDVSARRMGFFSENPIRVSAMSLMVECKKSERPWVFFSDPLGLVNPLLCIRHIASIEKLLPASLSGTAVVSEADLAGWQHPYSFKVPQTKTYIEFNPKKGDASGHQIRSALMTAVKSVDFDLNRLKKAFEGQMRFGIFSYPLVVLRGLLFEATTDEKGRIVVKQCPHVRVEVDYLEPGEKFDEARMRHIVDVLHEESLPQYLDLIEAGHIQLLQRVGELLSEAEKPQGDGSGQ